ncbi:hypothetical protein BGX28_000501 [Mortierella sp. GBA30]|nr:hypothetical protein BGX28_000501 [Mortierella sp. GBA30]
MTSSITTVTLSILSHNLLFLPEWRQSLGQSKRARLMAEADHLRGHDIVFLQEAWDSNATRIVREALQEQYPFQTPVAGHSYGAWNATSGNFSRLAATNAGVFIGSKWPIVFQQQHVFENASGSERLKNRGFVYAKILYSNSKHIHLINTHLQSDGALMSDFAECAQMRALQLQEIRYFIASSGIPHEEPVIIGGDLNVVKASQEYEALVEENLVVMEPTQFLGHPYSWDCRENSFIAHYSWAARMVLDYLLVAKAHSSRVRSLVVETMLVRPQESFQVSKWFKQPWIIHDYSDHYPIKATITVDL